jgi:cardiolipin synthase
MRLFEYTKVVLHAKIAVADQDFATIGSYNVNDISTYASVELNVDVHNKPFAGTVHAALTKIINEDCEEITTENYVQRNGVFHRLIQWCAYQIVRVLFYLFTFYFKQQR